MRLAARTMISAALVIASMLLGGCATGPRASLPALQQRAVFDLGCPAMALQLHHVDRRTKVVVGCGRRLIYVESCESRGLERDCTWKLDTPSYVQQTWPQLQPPAATKTPASLACAPCCTEPPREVAAPGRLGRPIRTDLDGPRQTVTKSPATDGRPVQTDLFDEDDQSHILDHRR